MLWCNQTGITTRDSDLPDLLDASDTRISRYQMTSFYFICVLTSCSQKAKDMI